MEYLDTRRYCKTCKRLGRDKLGIAFGAKARDWLPVFALSGRKAVRMEGRKSEK